MTTRIHVLAILIALGTLLLIARLVRRGGLRSKYALLWITSAALLLPLSVFPGLLDWYAHLIGIHYPPTALELTSLAVLFAVAFHFSWELSRTEDRVRRLAEEVALMLDASRLYGSVPVARSAPPRSDSA